MMYGSTCPVPISSYESGSYYTIPKGTSMCYVKIAMFSSRRPILVRAISIILEDIQGILFIYSTLLCRIKHSDLHLITALASFCALDQRYHAVNIFARKNQHSPHFQYLLIRCGNVCEIEGVMQKGYISLCNWSRIIELTHWTIQVKPFHHRNCDYRNHSRRCCACCSHVFHFHAHCHRRIHLQSRAPAAWSCLITGTRLPSNWVW